MQSFKWRKGFSSPVDAKTAGEFLVKLESENGSIKAKDVYERSKSRRSPLHKHFEWNDGAAAERFRLAQARDLIRNCIPVEITIDEAGREVEEESLFVAVTYHDDDGESDRGYVAIEAAAADEIQREQVIQQALGMIDGLRARLEKLGVSRGHVAQLERIKRELVAKQEREKAKKKSKPAKAKRSKRRRNSA